MIREVLADTLAGIIALAILGFAAELLGPTMAVVLVGASIVGFLARPVIERRRQMRADARMWRTMNRNRARLGLDSFPRPIGRVTRARIQGDELVVDAKIDRGFRPTNVGYSADQ